MRLVSDYIKDPMNVMALQIMLKMLRDDEGQALYDGKVDGIGGQETTMGLQRFLKEFYGYIEKKIDGEVGHFTRKAMILWGKSEPDNPAAQEAMAGAFVEERKAIKADSAIDAEPVAHERHNIRFTPPPNHYADLKQSEWRQPASMNNSVNMDRAFGALIGTESCGKQFGKDGKPLTSCAGAIGIAQVMPGTAPEAAKLAGLEWDPVKYKNDASYNAALGRAYFEKQFDTYGNLPMAYAAYNAGPGSLNRAIGRAKDAGSPNSWLDYLPDETQKYVTKNMTAYNSGGNRQNYRENMVAEELQPIEPRRGNTPSGPNVLQSLFNTLTA